MRTWKYVGTVLLAVAIASCTSHHPATPGSQSLGENDNGRTVRVTVGTTVTVVLHSTYWTFAATPAGGVLGPAGAPQVSASPVHACVPGQGCGSVTAGFTALRVGVASIVATRTVCGEAALCPPGQRTYRVAIVVGDTPGRGAPS